MAFEVFKINCSSIFTKWPPTSVLMSWWQRDGDIHSPSTPPPHWTPETGDRLQAGARKAHCPKRSPGPPAACGGAGVWISTTPEPTFPLSFVQGLSASPGCLLDSYLHRALSNTHFGTWSLSCEDGMFIILNSTTQICFLSMFVSKGPQPQNTFVFFLSIFRMSNTPLTGSHTQVLKFSGDKLFKITEPWNTFIEDFYDSRQDQCLWLNSSEWDARPTVLHIRGIPWSRKGGR